MKLNYDGWGEACEAAWQALKNCCCGDEVKDTKTKRQKRQRDKKDKETKTQRDKKTNRPKEKNPKDNKKLTNKKLTIAAVEKRRYIPVLSDISASSPSPRFLF